MVIDLNRLFSGVFLLTFLIICFFLKFDYFLLLFLIIFIIYDLYISNFINVKFDWIFLIFFFPSLFIVHTNPAIILYYNALLVIFVLINLLFKSFYFKKFFLLCLIIFILNFYAAFQTDREYIYLIILLAFFNDTVAYISGRTLKGPLIIPSVSPNKTWSGTLISFLLTCILIAQYGIYFLVAILLSLSLFFGDIFFSYIKRVTKLKDFSNLLKGHGGLLDRLDSMFFFIIIFNFYYLI